MQIEIDTDRLGGELEQRSYFSDAAAPAVTRILFSAVDLEARAWLKERCRLAGLQVREDAAGNTFARWTCSAEKGPAIGTGSHIDAIPNARRYDGTVGVLGGLAAISASKQSGFEPRRAIELLMFTSGEPTRFGIGCLGSRLLAGALDPRQASSLRDGSGMPLD